MVTFTEDDAEILFSNSHQLKSTSVKGKGETVTVIVDPLPDTDKIQWGPNKKLILISSKGSFKLWDSRFVPLNKIGYQTAFAKATNKIIAMHPDKKSITTFDATKLTNPNPIGSFTPPTNLNIDTISVSPCSSYLVVSGDKPGFKIVSLPSHEIAYERTEGKFLCFSPDSKRLCFSANGPNRFSVPPPHPHDRRIIIIELKGSSGVSLPLAGGSAQCPSSHPFTACFSNNQKYLLYVTHKGAQVYEFDKKVFYSVFNEPRMPTNIFRHGGGFSGNDERLVIPGNPTTIVYSVVEKRISLALSISSIWAVFSPRHPDIIIVGCSTQPVVQWWGVDGSLLHQFYFADIPDSISMDPTPDGYHLIVGDRAGYSYILSPYSTRADSAQFERLPAPKNVVCTDDVINKERKRCARVSVRRLARFAKALHDYKGYDEYWSEVADVKRRWLRQYQPIMGPEAYEIGFTVGAGGVIELGDAKPGESTEGNAGALRKFADDLVEALERVYKEGKPVAAVEAELEGVLAEFTKRADAEGNFGFTWQPKL